MSINNKLINFAQRELVLGRTDTERNKIETSLNYLEVNINDQLGGKIDDFIRFGSYTRNTILPRNYDERSDVDLMVVFDTSKNVYTPDTYRRWLYKVVEKNYPRSISKKDFPVVKLLLNHIMFDIVPAKSETHWMGSENYFIPDRDGSWMSTKPNDINSDLSYVNQQAENNTVRNVIRLMKHWNANAGYPFQSYLMEKEIIRSQNYFSVLPFGETTYDLFLNVLENTAGNISGVKQAIKYIKHYQGNMWRVREEEKELQWLKKLLPGLN